MPRKLLGCRRVGRETGSLAIKLLVACTTFSNFVFCSYEHDDVNGDWYLSMENPEACLEQFTQIVRRHTKGKAASKGCYGHAYIAKLLVDTMAPLLVHRNWDACAADCAAAACNLAAMLVNQMRGKVTEEDKILGLQATPLRGSPKGDTDNVYISYMGHEGHYSPHQFHEDQNNIDNLLYYATKHPTRASTPDWVVKMQGCPFLLGDGKSDREEAAGLDLLALLSVRILANMDTALVMQTTNTHMRLFRLETKRRHVKARGVQDPLELPFLTATKWESPRYDLSTLKGQRPTVQSGEDLPMPGVSNHDKSTFSRVFYVSYAISIGLM